MNSFARRSDAASRLSVRELRQIVLRAAHEQIEPYTRHEWLRKEARVREKSNCSPNLRSERVSFERRVVSVAIVLNVAIRIVNLMRIMR